jgi:ABC-2 type transport system permease protein
MRRIFAQARKEIIQIVRDRVALLLALLLPLVILFLLGNSISLTVNDLPIVVQDLDDSAASREFIDAFRASITFHVVSWPTDRQPELALSTNVARAALIIPVHFGREAVRGNPMNVQLLVDGSDANTAKLVQGYASQILRAWIQKTAGAARPSPIQAEIRLWYNPGRESKKFYGPGFFVLGLSMFPPLLAALAMSKEGEQKTILQVYASSIPAHEFLLGKIFAFMLIALCEWVLCLIGLLTYFGLSLAGDATPLLVGTVLYAFCVASFGTLVGSAIPNQAAAIQVVSLGGFLLAFLLSGLIFPIENIPAGLRWISNIVWARYYIQIVRDALLQGGGWPSMWFPVSMIGVIGSFFYLLAWQTMRRMQLKA